MNWDKFKQMVANIDNELTIDPVDIDDVVIVIDNRLVAVRDMFVVMNRMTDETATCALIIDETSYVPDGDTMANINLKR